MSNYYLCDGCDMEHDFAFIMPVSGRPYGCMADPCCTSKKVMTDEYEHPHEVCPHWKPKEAK